jgi:hypothetical protein
MKAFGKIEPRRRLSELFVTERERERERKRKQEREARCHVPFRFSGFWQILANLSPTQSDTIGIPLGESPLKDCLVDPRLSKKLFR